VEQAVKYHMACVLVLEILHYPMVFQGLLLAANAVPTSPTVPLDIVAHNTDIAELAKIFVAQAVSLLSRVLEHVPIVFSQPPFLEARAEQALLIVYRDTVAHNTAIAETRINFVEPVASLPMALAQAAARSQRLSPGANVVLALQFVLMNIAAPSMGTVEKVTTFVVLAVNRILVRATEMQARAQALGQAELVYFQPQHQVVHVAKELLSAR
jgi:hypothetical protein